MRAGRAPHRTDPRAALARCPRQRGRVPPPLAEPTGAGPAGHGQGGHTDKKEHRTDEKAHTPPPSSLPQYSQANTNQIRPQKAPPHQPAPGAGDLRGIPPLRGAPAGAPPPSSSLPRAALTSGERGQAEGPPLCRCRAAAARRGEAHFHFLWGSFFAVPCRAVRSRAASASPGTPPRPPLAAASPRSEGRKGCEAVPSCRAGRGRLSRHRPASLPAGAARGPRGGSEQTPRSPAATPPNPSCIPLPPFAVLTCHARGSLVPAAKGCCFFGA
ncbi:basic salivary proline-rich protein 4-like [Onychostruthus taczanowskii]|uniref:basic salivary proline-rich protein 4-like n=1 Tax=Onychostruthus taczanowskii TaxID=356909 RepID=UPI001B803E54|nr:basic salivary proline-rich protein 4-like [Onychostruthus taczanowskii]